MLKSKTMNRVCCAVMAVMVAVSILIWGTMEARRGDGSHEVGYETYLFDTGTVHTINITMDNWDSFIANATAEEYTDCNIEIDGEKYNHVAIRCKGNTSLSSVATLGSQRYSFKIEFDHFVEGMTYHGLDKISLNNLIQDATMMKDYLAYTLMNRMGVPSSLCSYVQINVNGEPWGLYLAVEGVEDAFMDRNGMTKGELYKPDSLSFGGGRGNGGDFDIDVFRVEEETEGTTDSSAETASSAQAGSGSADGFGASSGMPAQGGDAQGFSGSSGMPAQGGDGNGFGASSGMPAQDGDTDGFGASSGMPSGDFTMPDTADGSMPDMGDFNPGDMGGFGGFNFGMGNDDVKLIYSDDNPDSYSNIFNNAKTNINKKDKTRLIESIRKLNAKEDLDDVVDKDEVIRYMAVHNFLCNDDSYTGMMVHNYYLYEENGKLSIIPWDYNLGFGGFAASTDATSTVNSPIDSPVSSGTTDSRPLIAWIFSDEEALAEYHQVYSRFIAENIESGWLEAEISRVQEMITPYLEKDESKFFTMDEFTKAVDTLKTFCSRRGESIRGQLDGTIPSTSAGQRNSSALIDASDISTADMGSMNSTNGGGGFGGPGGGDSGFPGSGNFSMPGGTTGTNGGDTGRPEGTAETETTEAGTAGTQDTDTAPSAGTQGTDTAPSAGTQSTDTAPSAGTPSTDTAPSAGTQSTDTALSAGTQAQPDPNGQTAEAGTGTAETAAVDGMQTGAEEPAAAGTTAAGETAAPPQSGDRGGPPSGGGFSPPEGMNFGSTQQKNQSEQWIWLGILSALLIAAILVIRRVRPHNK